MKKKNQQQGFSLIEMIVAVSIFAISSVFISELFITSGRAQNRSGSQQKIQSDARIMLAQITDRIRSSEINYDFYGGTIGNPETVLALIDQNGQEVVIRISSNDFQQTSCPSASSTPCLEISEDGGATFEPMTSENFIVTNSQFYISPAKSPLTGLDFQPMVTMALAIQGNGPNDPEVPTYIQTSVSSRVYVR